jgi:beta-N-acetylhexosaminidase
VYKVLRNQLHFTGLTMTDSLSAGAIGAAHLSVERASVDAVEAGADIVLYGIPPKGSAFTIAHDITQQIFNAVASHALSRATIIAAVSQVLAAKDVDACTLH